MISRCITPSCAVSHRPSHQTASVARLESAFISHWNGSIRIRQARRPVELAAKHLAALEAVVEEMVLPPQFPDLTETHRLIFNVGLSRSLKAVHDKDAHRISDQLRGMIESGVATSPAAYRSAVAHADGCRRDTNSAFGGFDVLLCPSAPGEAPVGLGAIGDPVFQVMWTLLHLPCANVPLATGPNGLPVGIQFVGRQYDDDTVLAIANWFHQRAK